MERRSEFAVASLVLGLLSFIQIFGLEKALAAIVFGVLALQRIPREEGLKGKYLAIAGVVLGILAAVLIVVMVIVFMQQQMAAGQPPAAVQS